MRPELPYLAAGGIAVAGGVAREGGFPSNGIPAVVGTAILVIIASATSGSRVAPLVRAIGLLLFMAAAMSATKAFTDKKKRK